MAQHAGQQQVVLLLPSCARQQLFARKPVAGDLRGNSLTFLCKATDLVETI